ncbi:MAG TPA: hypothetical protein VK797_06965 [Tepidisphaeraceae bacterium]|nr:hypothetical protein [Tepidisphaeraceae bacterium]
MPVIKISDATFAELKSLAEPFVDTPESLTARLIHEEVVRRGTGRISGDANHALAQHPVSHENLAHTRLISATVDGHEMYRPKWNGLMVRLHALGLKRLGSFDALQRVSSARLRPGRFEEDGFKYVAESDFSIQGVDANLAWDHAFKLARALGIPIKAVFEWRQKEAAAHPGQHGVLEWSPPQRAQIRSPRLAHPEQAHDFRKQVLEISADAGL